MKINLQIHRFRILSRSECITILYKLLIFILSQEKKM